VTKPPRSNASRVFVQNVGVKTGISLEPVERIFPSKPAWAEGYEIWYDTDDGYASSSIKDGVTLGYNLPVTDRTTLPTPTSAARALRSAYR